MPHISEHDLVQGGVPVQQGPSDGIDQNAVKREAHGAAADILQRPEVQAAIETLRGAVQGATNPVAIIFPGDIADGFERQVREDLLRGISKALREGGGKDR